MNIKSLNLPRVMSPVSVLINATVMPNTTIKLSPHRKWKMHLRKKKKRWDEPNQIKASKSPKPWANQVFVTKECKALKITRPPKEKRYRTTKTLCTNQLEWHEKGVLLNATDKTLACSLFLLRIVSSISYILRNAKSAIHTSTNYQTLTKSYIQNVGQTIHPKQTSYHPGKYRRLLYLITLHY